MFTTLTLIGTLIVLGVMSYHRASLLAFSIAALVITAAVSALFSVHELTWVFLVLFIAVLNVRALRQSLITKPLFKAFKGVMPEMSRTEREAIEAGTTWWESDLFRGAPDWRKLHSYPAPRLSAEEQAFMDGPVETVCKMVNEWEICHRDADLSPEIWQYLKDEKFFAMIIKKEYGGLQYSAYAQSRVLQKLSGASTVLSSTVGVPNSLGPGELLQHYGTKEQQDYYLPRLATGLEIPCFALTSPEAGSDAGAIPDTGIVCMGEWEGEQVLGMRITWNKRYITLAPVATILGLAFKLEDPEGLLGGEEHLGTTCALIPTDIEGVEVGRRHFPLNVPFMNGPTSANDLFVPISFIIGGQKMAGQGWRMLVECLSVGRGITLPSASTGATKTAALATGAYARIRRQFKLPIGKMEGIEEPLARLAGNAYMMDAASKLTVTGIDLGEKPSVISAIVKYHLTHRGQRCAIDAMDVVGGKGICLGPNNFLGRSYQGAPIGVTVEGANILTRSMIIYGQGAIRCHPYVLKEMQAAANPDAELGLKDFDNSLFSHIGFAISNFARSLWFGLGGWRFISAPQKDQTAQYYRQITRYSTHLALLSDVAMATLGGNLKRKERVSARLGDILSQIYLSSATLKRYDDDGRNVADLPLLHWSIQDAHFQMQQATDELLRNFPIKIVGKLMRLVIFPLGMSFEKPSDKLDHTLAQILQTPSETRDRLGNLQYLSRDEGNPVGMLEQALDDMLLAEPVYDKLCKAAGKRFVFMYLDRLAQRGLDNDWITEDEAKILQRAEVGRLRTINVDDFDHDELVAGRQPVVAQSNAA
ncbi:acyl-CoA dehydrogenase [Alginatibacterium sediminis]|uniref:Acyl-coenzyme A dehydrogenase n=1 Tax=Alginatibacterium sediminis TaxID=2164068 RepID=A0A420EBL9_9ALTE|nr:acyl-CoA dehydrogenase FadE [Alginatibacterium sediminis]RKF18032.1 acyl-CoA dehydrogenase [Alginatibacterium sediminis]